MVCRAYAKRSTARPNKPGATELNTYCVPIKTRQCKHKTVTGLPRPVMPRILYSSMYFQSGRIHNKSTRPKNVNNKKKQQQQLLIAGGGRKDLPLFANLIRYSPTPILVSVLPLSNGGCDSFVKATSGLFSGSSELLAFPSRKLHQIMDKYPLNRLCCLG